MEKVLFISNYYYPYVSGVTEYIRMLAEDMVRQGYDVKVLTSNHNRLPKYEIVNGVKVERAPIWCKISKGTVSPAFIRRSVLLSNQYDYINMHLPMLESGIISTFIPRDKLTVTYHCDINLTPGIINDLIVKVMDISNQICLKRAKNIMVNTIEYSRESRVLPNYMNKLIEVSPPVKAMQPVKREIHEKRIIGFCGRIVEEKGIDILIKAFEIIRKNRRDVELIIGGDYENIAGGSIYSSLKEYINKHDIQDVYFVGRVPESEMSKFYSSLDVFVLPSINSLESFGMVQVEAMMCGTPVVVSDLPGVRTIVQKTGMGLICRRQDTEDLARCIEEVLDNREMFLKDEQHINAVYSTEITREKYIEAFHIKKNN